MFRLVVLFSLLKIGLCICPNGTISSFSNPNNCYHIEITEKSFIVAESFCRDQFGGHLASVHNAFDNMFLSRKKLESLAFVQNNFSE